MQMKDADLHSIDASIHAMPPGLFGALSEEAKIFPPGKSDSWKEEALKSGYTGYRKTDHDIFADYKEVIAEEIKKKMLAMPANQPSRTSDLTMPPKAAEEDKSVPIEEFVAQFHGYLTNKPTTIKNNKALQMMEMFVTSTVRQMSQLQAQITTLQAEIKEKVDKPKEEEKKIEDPDN